MKWLFCVFALILLETDGPKQVKATKSSNQVKEKDFVTLTCSAKGSPDVSFMWVKDKIHNTSGAELKFTSITASDSGSYHCTAWNEYGIVQSNTVDIDVLCKYFFIYILKNIFNYLKKLHEIPVVRLRFFFQLFSIDLFWDGVSTK